ncbi:MAG: hypothetical protein JNM62_02140 [Flavobacteriales bacterium]|nr:hypothetical protein [Flavobacteriales bacterium]
MARTPAKAAKRTAPKRPVKKSAVKNASKAAKKATKKTVTTPRKVAKKAASKSAPKKAPPAKKPSPMRTPPARKRAPVKAAAKKGATAKRVTSKPRTGKGEATAREFALYGKEVEQVKHQRRTPEPAADVLPDASKEHMLPKATYDPTPDTNVHPRGHTGPDRFAQSERVAAMRRTRARNARTGIPNAGNRKRRG